MTAEYLTFSVDAVLAIGVIAFALAQWRNGRSALNTETVQTYKDLLEATEKKYASRQDDMQKQINEGAARLGELSGTLKAKEQQLADYRQIIENRNPNLEKILTQVVDFMEKVDRRLSDIAEHQKKPFVAEASTTTTIHK